MIFVYHFQNNYSQTTTTLSVVNINSNNEHSNLGVSFFDDNFVVYSTQIDDRIDSSTRSYHSKNKNKEFLDKNIDFYFGAIKNGDIVNSQKLSREINSEYTDLGLYFDKNRKFVFFSRERVIKDSKEKHFELFRAEVVSPDSWVKIKKLPFNYTEYSIVYPSLSHDNKTLYFASNKSGNYDIYKVSILSEWGFGVPEKLATNVNSSFNETSPFIQGNTLFFSSNKPGGLGGYDIYSINLTDKDATAKRLLEPINSTSDDLSFINTKHGEGFFSSNRAGGKGLEDIYFFKNFEFNNVVVSDDVVSNSKNIPEIETVKITKETLVKNESAYNFQRRNSFDTKIETEEIEVVKPFTNSSNIRKDDKYSKCQMEFDKINNIYFDFDESYIKAEAAIELDKVIRVLQKCTHIKLLATSHTDSRASNDYNLELSQRRSNSVMHYIKSNGQFPADRIIASGYGEGRLANRCSDGVKCTEREHQTNRRTHFEIYNY